VTINVRPWLIMMLGGATLISMGMHLSCKIGGIHPCYSSFLDTEYSLRRHILKKRVEDVKSLTMQPDIIYHK
jgi:hypothetical protein